MTVEEDPVRFGDNEEEDPLASPSESDLSDSESESELMDPNHPLLARAQAALKEQLSAARQDFEEQLRQCKEELKVRLSTRAHAAFFPPSPPPLAPFTSPNPSFIP